MSKEEMELKITQFQEALSFMEKNIRADERAKIIDMIFEHQKECDALGIIASAQWVREQLEEQN